MNNNRRYGFEVLVVIASCLPIFACAENRPHAVAASNRIVPASQPPTHAAFGQVSILDGGDLDGSSTMPGAGLRLHNETEPEEDICGIFIEAAGSPPGDENRLHDGVRLQPGVTIGIPLTPGTWNIRMDSCTKGKLVSAQVHLDEGKVKSLTVNGRSTP